MKKNTSRTNTYLLILIILTSAVFVLFLWDSICSKGVKLPDDNDILNARLELLEKHETWTIGFMGIAIAIATVLIGLFQLYFTKKAEDNVFSGLAEIANEDKEAFKEAVRMKSVELELMSDYPIYIIYDPMKQKKKSEELYKLLSAYHFNDINKPLSYEGAFLEKFCQKSILMFCDDSFDKDKCIKILNRNPKVGVFGFGKKEEYFKLPEHDCLNYANSSSSVYNNLMSLLHYKRYLNSTIANDSLQC
jgi:hypothetical protein